MLFNKRNLVLCALMLALIVMVTGCTANKEPKSGNGGEAGPQDTEVILATTTSTRDSGLLDVLIPMFEEETGYVVKPIAVGTGQALELGKQGEADVLLVHAPAAEKEVVEAGAAINRQLVMHNDFVIVGSAADPAGIRGLKTAREALAKIAESEALFVSRGDDSGTHKKEKGYWQELEIEASGEEWYLESGSGMGQTLNIASEKEGYTLTDRATYLALKDNLNLEVLVEGDASLLNIYHVMQVNPEKFEMVNAEGGKAFVEFFVSPHVQEVISTFGVEEYGEPLFFPDAGKAEAELGL